jgi:hypothetical protein
VSFGFRDALPLSVVCVSFACGEINGIVSLALAPFGAGVFGVWCRPRFTLKVLVPCHGLEAQKLLDALGRSDPSYREPALSVHMDGMIRVMG